MQGTPTIYTVGHSTRPIEELIAMLASFEIALVADVRTVPQSRRNPQFGQASLRRSLAEAGIDYRHMKSLGGLRHPAKDSPNTAWRNDSFRGYADYMQTPEFASALDKLVEEAAARRTAIMCAEAVPWRCHRSLIADALLARGSEAVHIMAPGSGKPHELTRFAKVQDGRVTYPG